MGLKPYVSDFSFADEPPDEHAGGSLFGGQQFSELWGHPSIDPSDLARRLSPRTGNVQAKKARSGNELRSFKSPR
jgi:hypothetical protein